MEAERLVACTLVFQKLQRVVGKNIACIRAFVYYHFAVFNHRRTIVVTPAVGHRIPGVESALWFETVSQMPLTAKPGLIAGAVEFLYVVGQPLDKPMLIDGRGSLKKIMNSMPGRNGAGKDRGSGR